MGWEYYISVCLCDCNVSFIEYIKMFKGEKGGNSNPHICKEKQYF